MADEDSSAMNLDLNLGPVDNLIGGNDPTADPFDDGINLEDWLRNPRSVNVIGISQHNQRLRSLWRHFPIPPETLNLALEMFGGDAPDYGEGSVVEAINPTPTEEVPKSCENGPGHKEDEAQGKRKDSGKNNGDDGSFFDCNICLDWAREPVVTCCGHLFCWPCLYRWLHHHSDAKECPVCKGEVTSKNVTPIYGRGDSAREPDMKSAKIPQRPQARRVESWRQTIQRAAFSIPMEEMIRRLGSTFDLSWGDVAQNQSRNSDGPAESPERSNALLSRILTSRGLRRERTQAVSSVDGIDSRERSSPNPDSREGGSPNHETRDNRWLSSLLYGRSNSYRAANVTSAINGGPDQENPDANRLIDAFYENPGPGRGPVLLSGDQGQGQGPAPASEDRDRDSLSSIAAVMHSESQTVDNAVETESTVSLSTSSSRRRYDASRISDVDSGDSRPPRRRRLN